ncbi:carboxylesterase type B [Corynebacterium deserti GIMN1.010]|uniref:Carboxylic ester hydrolase n=1 Tax=Corynebacterium deserti GIMN1.010 TaxID=931089 RepID=A0A0M4CKH3_9CORY|nr:alpha/beta fold hydrolase [Corynebacterium deserti]ALC06464.1 carboxylesterase type B [Corynebacterium deserti GIMN1.010]
MSATSAITVTCPAGEITGGPHFFRSIPYARARAFHDAEKLEPMRIDATGMHEGLYLSLSTPQARFGADAPVIVFIHGGGYESGTREDPRNDPKLFRKHGVVMVSVDYRVGLDGFARFHDDEPNRYRGLDDCVLALEWVQKNIEHFGGDPTNVTLIGQSAGAGMALWLARPDHYKGAFRRLIALSPSFPRQPFKARKAALRRALGKPVTRASLAKLTPARLAAGYKRFARRYFNDLALGPFPYDPNELAEIDLIISSTRDEMYNHGIGQWFDNRKLGAGLAARLMGVINREAYIKAARSIDDRVVGRTIGDAMIRKFVAQTEKGWWIEFPGRHCDDLTQIFCEDSEAHRIVLSFVQGETPTWPAYSPENRVALSLVDGPGQVVSDPLKMVRLAF